MILSGIIPADAEGRIWVDDFTYIPREVWSKMKCGLKDCSNFSTFRVTVAFEHGDEYVSVCKQCLDNGRLDGIAHFDVEELRWTSPETT